MVSNEVMENEQKLLQQQVVEAKLKKLPTYNELNDKLQAVTLQIQILVTKIESGILSLDGKSFFFFFFLKKKKFFII